MAHRCMKTYIGNDGDDELPGLGPAAPQRIGTRMRNSRMILKVTALPMQSGTRIPTSVGTAMTFSNMIQRSDGPAQET